MYTEKQVVEMIALNWLMWEEYIASKWIDLNWYKVFMKISS